MRKQDIEVREVVCSETGKPMPKIPLWMSDIKVKFISDEARQRHPSIPSAADFEPVRRTTVSASDIDELKSIGSTSAAIEEADPEFDDAEADTEDADSDDTEE